MAKKLNFTFKEFFNSDEAKKRGINNTAATCTLMQMLGKRIFFSKGSEENLKITTVDDMAIFEALLHVKKQSWIK